MNPLPCSRVLRIAAGPALLALTLALAGCEDEGPLDPDPADPDETVYLADLTQLNDSGVTGRAGFTIHNGDDRFEAAVEAAGLADGDHPMFVHERGACPTSADDVNGDGFVDILEGAAVFGRILISLDDNLDDNRLGEGEFPDESTIDYEESTDLGDLVEDLRRVDEDPTDVVATLGATESLDLQTRSVVLYGVGPNAVLPGSVQTIGGLPAQTTLPVACGVIRLR